MAMNRKMMCGVFLALCLTLILSSQVVTATTLKQHGVSAAGANSPGGAPVAAYPFPSSSDAAAARAHVNLGLANAAEIRAAGRTPDTENTANGVSGVASGAKEVALQMKQVANTDAATRVALLASASSVEEETTSAPQDYGPIITGPVITGLVVVICFAGVLGLLVLVEIVPHAKRWVRACRGEPTEKTDEEVAADGAYEKAARERVEEALRTDGTGKDKADSLSGVECTVEQTK